MQSLFYPKNGLGFFHISEGIKSIQDAPEYILETFDETFQVERRVLDTLVMNNARRLGVEVVQGALVDIKDSQLSSGACVVRYSIGPGKESMCSRGPSFFVSTMANPLSNRGVSTAAILAESPGTDGSLLAMLPSS